MGRAQHLCKTTLFDFPLRARRTGFYHWVGALLRTGLRPFALPHPDAAGVVLCSLHGLRARRDGNLRSLEDVFADRCLCRVNLIFYIDVGRVGTLAAVNLIPLTVHHRVRVYSELV